MNKHIVTLPSKPKVFCIGLPKTGSTTLEKTLFDLNYQMGNQREGELLMEDWAAREFDRILDFCYTADAFQDAPFCFPYTYQILDYEFPDAKFILSVRDNVDQWYKSITNFHGKIWGKDGRIPPTSEDLKNANYIYKGRPYRNNRLLYNTSKDDPYNKLYFTAYYYRHIKNVSEYFRHKPHKLIKLNVSKKEDYSRLCIFLEKEPVYDDFPWLNKT